MKNTRSEGELRQVASGTPSPTYDLAPPIPRGRTRSVDASVAAGARPRPIPQRRLTPAPPVASTSVQCVLHENAEVRYDHAVYPSPSPGVPAQYRSEVTVPVGGCGLNGAKTAGNHPPWYQQQPSLIEMDDPLQIFDGTPALLSPESNRPRPGGDRSPNRQDYAQALIYHQKSRRDALEARLKADRQRCMLLKLERQKKEDLLMRKRQDRGTQFPTVKDLKEVTETVYKLRVQCELTNRRIESLQRQRNAGPGNGEFYSNMERLGCTGQNTTSAALAPAFSRSIPGQVAANARPLPTVDPPTTTVTDAEADEFGPRWGCLTCTFLNHQLLSACEMCETPKPLAETNGVAAAATSPDGHTTCAASNAGTCYCCPASSGPVRDVRISISHRQVQS